MRFGTFFFFQAAPGMTHAEVIHRELEQMESARTEEVPDARGAARPH